MPTKVDPGLLAIGSGKAAQDSVSVSSLDFASIIDFQAALSAHVNDPEGSHSASAIAIQDIHESFDDTDAEGALVELSDLKPDQPNVLGEERLGIPNSGVPDWGSLEDAETGTGEAQTGGFTCATANHGHASWVGGNQGISPENWLAETKVLIPSSVTSFEINGTLYPADRGYLVLLYATKGVFGNDADTKEVGVLDLASPSVFDELRRRNASVGYQQVDYTASQTPDVGPDIFSLTHRLPALKTYDSSAPYSVYDFNYLQFQIATFSTGTIDLTASPFNIGSDVDFGSLKLFHFKVYSNIASADYTDSNFYGSSEKLDIYSDVDPALPALGTSYGVEPANPDGDESSIGPFNVDLTDVNKLTSGTSVFNGDSSDRGRILVISDSTQGNNGVYQVLKESAVNIVYVYPNFPGTLPDTVDPTAIISAPDVFQLSGIYHYGSDNGFWVESTIAGLWNKSYLTSNENYSKVSSDYLGDELPLKYGLENFGASDRDVPYHMLDNNDVINGPDGFDLDKGNGPDSVDSAQFLGGFISGSGSGNASYDALVKNTFRTPFAVDHILADTGLSKKILVNTHLQTVDGKSQIEGFVTELLRYDLKSDLFNLGVKYPIAPYDKTPSSNTDGFISDTNTFSTSSTPFLSGDVGKIILISGTSNGNDGTYRVITFNSTSEVLLEPNWPGGAESTVDWRFPVIFASDVSLATLDQDELQVLGGKLVYPKINHTTDSYPENNQNDYSALGDPPDTIRWYTRLFDTGSPTNVGKIRIRGIDQASFEADTYTGVLADDHSGGAIVFVKIPGVTGWLDLGRANGVPNLDKTQDYYGCQIYSPGITDLVTSVTTPSSVALSTDKIYWADVGSDKIQRSNLDGSSIEDLVTGLNNPSGIALTADKIYWVNSGDDKIQRSNLDGSSIEDLITGLSDPFGIALSTDKIYWTDVGSDKIQRSNLDGSSIEDLIIGLTDPRGIALDLNEGKMYWVMGDKVYRSNLNGTYSETLITGLSNLYGIALNDSSMYLTDIGSDKVLRATLDGFNIEDLVTGLSNPTSIGLGTDKVYWTSDDKIQTSELDGTGVVYTYTTDFYTQNNGDGEFPIAVRVGFIKDGVGENHEVDSIEWLSY